ncbi:MAG: hypothetical protein AAFX76_05690 [Planctomycetota bacterium]
MGDTPSDWVAVRTYNTAEEAHVDRAMLAGSGIPTQLSNEFLVATEWSLGVAVGVDLLVPDTRQEEAAALVYDNSPETSPGRSVGPSFEADENWTAVNKDADGRRCPQCGSTEVYRSRAGRGWAMLTILVFWFPVAGLRQWRCEDCGVRVPG